jgi:hypothetical protein
MLQQAPDDHISERCPSESIEQSVCPFSHLKLGFLGEEQQEPLMRSLFMYVSTYMLYDMLLLLHRVKAALSHPAASAPREWLCASSMSQGWGRRQGRWSGAVRR